MSEYSEENRAKHGVITKQPTSQDPPPMLHNVWMARPPRMHGSPPGLEYLLPLEQLHVIQKRIWLDCSKLEFTVMNSGGQHMYYIKENTGCCTRWCCCAFRSMDLQVLDIRDNEIMHLEMPWPCCCNYGVEACCFPFMFVYAPPGQSIGEVKKLALCSCSSYYAVLDANGEKILTFQAPYLSKWSMRNAIDLDLPIEDANGMRIGSITKKYSGYERSRIFMGYYFVVTFPIDLDVNLKALLLAAAVFFCRELYQAADPDVGHGARTTGALSSR